VNDERLKKQKCLKNIYDKFLISPKDVGDDNLKHHLINELTKAKLHEGYDVGRLLIIFLFLNLKVIHE
jgi:hypothetical protein